MYDREEKIVDISNELQYFNLCRHILENGSVKEDRTGTGTISVFGYQMRFNMRKGFPLLTTKDVLFDKSLGEMLAFIHGETNANVIADKYGFKIWKKWSNKNGELGPIYGKQWRKWETTKKTIAKHSINKRVLELEPITIDQLAEVIKSIKEDPNGRRHIVTAWNPGDLNDMALPPCHMTFQFYVDNGKLSLQLYQRSADVFLGVPFNIAGYSALLHMIALITDLEPFEFIHTLGDAHIYLNHVEQVKEQLTRYPKTPPKLELNKNIKSIDDFWFDDFTLVGYNPHPPIKGKVSV